MIGTWKTLKPGWDPEGDAEYIAGLMEHIPTVEDDYERWGAECELEWRREEAPARLIRRGGQGVHSRPPRSPGRLGSRRLGASIASWP